MQRPAAPAGTTKAVVSVPGAATVEDETTPSDVSVIGTNHSLVLSMTTSATGTTLSVAVRAPSGAFVFSSDWNGSQTVEDQISRGRISIS